MKPKVLNAKSIGVLLPFHFRTSRKAESFGHGEQIFYILKLYISNTKVPINLVCIYRSNTSDSDNFMNSIVK